jgi:hypothetical protein
VLGPRFKEYIYNSARTIPDVRDLQSLISSSLNKGEKDILINFLSKNTPSLSHYSIILISLYSKNHYGIMELP